MNPAPLRVWLVDDDASIRWVLERALRNAGMAPRAFDAAEPAMAAFRSDSPDVLITDVRMTGASGLDLLKRVHEAHPDLPVIVMTAHSDLGSAVSAYESGAFEYLPKPFDIDQAVDLVRRAAQAGVRPGEIPGATARMPELLESELFGHERGSFTGADTLRRGRFEQADGGTLFLDEIGDMSMPLQTRLLRVLAEVEFYRVGGQTPIRVDVRVIAATHQHLEQRVEQGLFREDLFHRLNVIRIELPPLRARREDVPSLLGHYLLLAAQELGVESKTLTPAASELLAAYAWPGNVRELVNLCRRMTVLAPGNEIHIEDLPAEITSAGAPPAAAADWTEALTQWAERASASGKPLLDDALPAFERTLISVALRHTQGHRQAGAKLLGWGRNTLTRKLKELGMDDSPE